MFIPNHFISRNRSKYDNVAERYASLHSFTFLTFSVYSRVQVRYALDSMSGWIQGRNLCYDRKTQIWNAYTIRGNAVNIRAYGKQCRCST